MSAALVLVGLVVTGATTRSLAMGFGLFAALVWGALLLVLVVFLFVLYGVVRAGGVDLEADDKSGDRPP